MDIKKVAKLSRLSLQEGEEELFANEFKKILQYFDQISKVDTTAVDPLRTPIELNLSLREDLAVDWDKKDEAMAQAPEVSYNQYKVPPVI